MRKRFYITTPIYYVNDVPHIGHAYTTAAADILARFNRMMGKEVFFLTGTDEHGQKVEKAAELHGRSPLAHANLLCENFKSLWRKLAVSNDAFIRTTDPQHVGVVQDMLARLYEKGEIEKRLYTGWYCTHDERFWTEKEILDGNCPDCKRPVETIEEENYFFVMSRYQERLIDYIKSHPGFILPETRRNEVLGFLKSNILSDLCISRPLSRLSWGIVLPFDKSFVTYVWFDALLNYYSATRYLAPLPSPSSPEGHAGGAGADELWWPATHHLVGKDILTTHAVFWPTMLMALDMAIPDNIFAHGWWTVEGRKMSKSLGNVVDPFLMIDTYGVDAFRYFLFREVPFGLDGDFSEDALIGRINSDLANDLGNLANRTLSMAKKYFQGIIPAPAGVELELKALAEGILFRLDDHLRVPDFHRALETVWELVSALNKYIDSSKPWALARKAEDEGKLRTVIYSALEGLRFLALYLHPFIPVSMERLYRHITAGEDIGKASLLDETTWGLLPSGRELGEMAQLFPRVEKKEHSLPSQTQELGAGTGNKAGYREKVEQKAPHKTKQKGQNKADNKEGNVEETRENLISIEDFAKIALKTGTIRSAEPVEGSNKLIKLEVDTGEIRQVVAGIGKAYTPQELVGKRVVVVTNLKPARLMGVESQGMVLAASHEGKLVLVAPEGELPPGSVVK